MSGVDSRRSSVLYALYREDVGEEGGECSQGDEPDPDCEEYVTASPFDGRSASLETFHDTLPSSADSVGKREGKERTDRATRNESRPGQTGQDRTRSPEARERISEPKYSESENWPLAALAGLEFGERLREPRDGMETGRREEVELKETQDD